MFLKIKTWFIQLTTFTKVVWVFVPVIAGAVKLVTIHDSNILAKNKAEQEQLLNKTDLKSLLIKVDTINDMLIRHMEAQIVASSEVTIKLDNVTGNQAKLKSLVTSEFAKTMTPKQVYDMMNFINNEKKKDYLFWIPYSGTQQNLTSDMKR